jgi:hypothetical protein
MEEDKSGFDPIPQTYPIPQTKQNEMELIYVEQEMIRKEISTGAALKQQINGWLGEIGQWMQDFVDEGDESEVERHELNGGLILPPLDLHENVDWTPGTEFDQVRQGQLDVFVEEVRQHQKNSLEFQKMQAEHMEMEFRHSETERLLAAGPSGIDELIRRDVEKKTENL